MPLAELERLASLVLTSERQRTRLLARQETLLYAPSSSDAIDLLRDLRRQLDEAETRVVSACAGLRGLGTDIVKRDPLTLTVPNLPRDDTRFLWLDGGIAHVTLLARA